MHAKYFKVVAIISGVIFLILGSLMPTAVGMTKCVDPVKSRITKVIEGDESFTQKELCSESYSNFNYIASCYESINNEYFVKVSLVENLGALIDKNGLTLSKLKNQHNYSCSPFRELLIQ